MIRRSVIAILVLSAFVSAVNAQVPKLEYSSYLGGSGAEWGYAVATDAAGAIYIAGFTQSTNLAVVNAWQPNYGGGTGDLFVAKLKPDGSVAYLTYVGGSGGEGDPGGYVGGLAVDAQGNAYVAGITRSQDFPTTTGVFQGTIGSKFVCDADPNAGLCGDAFVLKLSPAGQLIYSTYLGGSDYDDAKAIAVDATGAAYITGMTASPNFPTTPGAFRTQPIDVDAYVAKLSPDGSQLVYSTLLAGTGFEAGMAIAVDAQGRAYVAGTTQSADFPLKNALQSNFGAPWDAFVARVNAAGTDVDFSTYLGGQGSDQAFGIALDASGNIYVAGATNSPDFPVKNAFQPVFGGGDTNGFVTKIPNDGSAIVYSTFLGGSDGHSTLNTITINAAGDAYVAGQGGSDFPIVNSFQPYGGAGDAVMAKLSADGSTLLYSSFLGGSGLDLASGIALDPSGRPVITGQTSSPDFPVSQNAFQTALGGPSDAFVVRLAESPSGGAVFSSAKSIAMGQTYVGQGSAPQTLRVTNPGSAALNISSIVPSGNVQAGENCVTVSPGASCSLVLAITATVAGDNSGTITVYDDAPDSPQTIFINAAGVLGGDLVLSSVVTGSSFSYYGEPAYPITATIVNDGPYESDDITLIATSSAGSANCSPCYVGSIKAGASAVARFNFTPSSYGAIPLTLQVQASAATPDLTPSNNTQTINIVNPHYAVSPAQLVFVNQTVNVPGDPQRITFTSLDGVPLQLFFAIAGDFSATPSCIPGALTCYADVVFLPTAAGTRAGTLTVTDASDGTIQPIALTGTGVMAAHAKVSPGTLNFVASLGNQWSSPQVLTITNDGSAALWLVGFTMAGNFMETNQCPPSLQPGESCAIEVSFLPAQAGHVTGSLTIFDNAANRSEFVALAGTGIPPLNPIRPNRPSSADPNPPSNANVTRQFASGLRRPVPAAPRLVTRPTATAARSSSPSTASSRPSSKLSRIQPARASEQ